MCLCCNLFCPGYVNCVVLSLRGRLNVCIVSVESTNRVIIIFATLVSTLFQVVTSSYKLIQAGYYPVTGYLYPIYNPCTNLISSCYKSLQVGYRLAITRLQAGYHSVATIFTTIVPTLSQVVTSSYKLIQAGYSSGTGYLYPICNPIYHL